MAFRQLQKLLDDQDRRRFSRILAASSAGGVLDLLGLAAVAPFVAIAARPELVAERGWLSVLYNLIPWGGTKNFVTVLGLASFFFLSATLVYRVALFRATLNFAESLKRKLTVRLTKLYLSQPYEFFLGTNSSDLKKHCSQEVNQVVQGFLLPLTSAISKMSGALILIVTLLVLEPFLAGIFILFFALAALLLLRFLSHRWKEEGKQHLQTGRGAERLLDQAFHGLRELKLAGREQFIVQNLERTTAHHQEALMNFQVATEVKVSSLRFLGLGGLILTTIILINSRTEVALFVPVLGVLIVAIYRLLPSLQGMLNAISRIQFSLPILESISQTLELPVLDGPDIPEAEDIVFSRQLEVRDLSFSYPGGSKPVLDNVSFTLPKGGTMAFVGRSGAGKTTLLDLMAGLLPAGEGSLLIDGVDLRASNVRAWREKVGYVSQESFLLDDTVKANIALGFEESDVDEERLRQVAQLAQIHDFIGTLPDGFNSRVGQNGTWLSGGQKQRLAIARALYRHPEVLILDEATSALDIFTEQKVLHAISELRPSMTLIIVTHRMDPLRECDAIHLIDGEGRMKASGTFDELLESSWLFRKLAGR
ncbi:MAG: ABC transporter ATP-binding protein [Candidatus Eremiobacteraeota bacterium]|nr:ABC transporter ATP-binding protein [Candidatus Eremiobacteraeota bacterium]